MMTRICRGRGIAVLCKDCVQRRPPAAEILSFRTFHERFHVHSTFQEQTIRYFRSSPMNLETDGEQRLTDILIEKLSPSYIQVRDISGGCGTMYELVIDSEKFKGKRLIQQHRMINEALEEEVKKLHGLTIRIGNPKAKT